MRELLRTREKGVKNAGYLVDFVNEQSHYYGLPI